MQIDLTLPTNAKKSKTSDLSYHVDYQKACSERVSISKNTLVTWAKKTLSTYCKSAEITIRLVDKEEITELNRTYRKHDKPTNVLAFPSSLPDDFQKECSFLGDIVICPLVVKEEAISHHQPYRAHFAHMVIHGILHLLGHDHIEEDERIRMQIEETKLLQAFGFESPWQDDIHES